MSGLPVTPYPLKGLVRPPQEETPHYLICQRLATRNDDRYANIPSSTTEISLTPSRFLLEYQLDKSDDLKFSDICPNPLPLCDRTPPRIYRDPSTLVTSKRVNTFVAMIGPTGEDLHSNSHRVKPPRKVLGEFKTKRTTSAFVSSTNFPTPLTQSPPNPLELHKFIPYKDYSIPSPTKGDKLCESFDSPPHLPLNVDPPCLSNAPVVPPSTCQPQVPAKRSSFDVIPKNKRVNLKKTLGHKLCNNNSVKTNVPTSVNTKLPFQNNFSKHKNTVSVPKVINSSVLLGYNSKYTTSLSCVKTDSEDFPIPARKTLVFHRTPPRQTEIAAVPTSATASPSCEVTSPPELPSFVLNPPVPVFQRSFREIFHDMELPSHERNALLLSILRTPEQKSLLSKFENFKKHACLLPIPKICHALSEKFKLSTVPLHYTFPKGQSPPSRNKYLPLRKILLFLCSEHKPTGNDVNRYLTMSNLIQSPDYPDSFTFFYTSLRSAILKRLCARLFPHDLLNERFCINPTNLQHFYTMINCDIDYIYAHEFSYLTAQSFPKLTLTCLSRLRHFVFSEPINERIYMHICLQLEKIITAHQHGPFVKNCVFSQYLLHLETGARDTRSMYDIKPSIHKRDILLNKPLVSPLEKLKVDSPIPGFSLRSAQRKRSYHSHSSQSLMEVTPDFAIRQSASPSKDVFLNGAPFAHFKSSDQLILRHHSNKSRNYRTFATRASASSSTPMLNRQLSIINEHQSFYCQPKSPSSTRGKSLADPGLSHHRNPAPTLTCKQRLSDIRCRGSELSSYHYGTNHVPQTILTDEHQSMSSLANTITEYKWSFLSRLHYVPSQRTWVRSHLTRDSRTTATEASESSLISFVSPNSLNIRYHPQEELSTQLSMTVSPVYHD
jgi:hypothetical protein